MKKVKLSALTKVRKLSRNELRNLIGGEYGSENSGGLTCNLGADCSVYWSDGKVKGTTFGKCSTMQIGSTVNCYCSAQPPDSTITSNGGMSHCWS